MSRLNSPIPLSLIPNSLIFSFDSQKLGLSRVERRLREYEDRVSI
jgi:hypothetical protein